MPEFQTEHEEQATSYEAQMDYYTNYITSRDDRIFIGMYSDEGITATNTKKREGFNQMIEDALAGKIDIIITKSVSRFARNTVDSLTTVRELKEKGVEIYFEKENIWTLDAKGELLITIMSSLAQEESRSISENTTWGKRKMFADGRASIGFKHFLGYDRGPDGEFIINEEQAVTVRYIYKRYLEGYSTYKIACELTEMGVKTPAGKDKWHPSSVMSILQNEKHKGDALLQKTFTKDFLTHKLVVNNGEVPQYYVEGHHEGIVTADQFDQVQAEILRRKGMQKYSGVGLFSSIIKCGECGSWYGAKVWHSNDKYRRVIYRCNNKYSDGCKCKTPHINEDELKELFIKAANELFSERDEFLANAKVMMEMVCNTGSLDATEKEPWEWVRDFLSDCIVDEKLEYIQMFHLSRRLEGTNLKVNNNLQQLLIEESPLSDFFRKHKVTFKLSEGHIDMYYKGEVQLLDDEFRYDGGNVSYMKSRLGYFKNQDFCVNGYAFRSYLEKNQYYSCLSRCPELVDNIARLLSIQEMSTDYYNNSKYYCIEYLIPMSDVIFDMAYPPETVEEKTAEFLQQAILRLYDEWVGSSFGCDDNLILRLSDDACIKPEWFVEAEEL